MRPTVSTLAAFTANTTNQTTAGFNSTLSCSPPCFQNFDPSLTVNGITFSSNSGFGVNVNSALWYGPGDLTNAYLVNVYTPPPNGPTDLALTISLPTAVTAFGLDFSTLFSSTTATFTLSNGFTTTANTSNATTNFETQFLGFISTTPFDSITFSVPNVFITDQGSNTSYVVADVVTASATPLPAALPLFASGLGGLGLLGWRRKRKATSLAA